MAQNLWGDASLWYLLADANGMSGTTELTAGQTITIPNKVINRHNNSDTFRPYDPNEAMGDTSPTDAAKPPKPKMGKCGQFGQILQQIVTLAVTIAVSFTPLAPIAPIIGNLYGQAFGLATGIQTGGFNWKSFGMAVVTTAVSFGVGQVVGQGAIAGSQFAGDVVRGALTSAVSQGIGVATHLQDKFDWAGVAVAGVTAGVSGAVSRGIGGLPAAHGTPSFGTQLVSGLAGAVAGAATRSVATGSDFGDNLIAALPDVIVQTVGRAIGNRIAGGQHQHDGSDVSHDPDVRQLPQPAASSGAEGAPTSHRSARNDTPMLVQQSAESSSVGAGLIGSEQGTYSNIAFQENSASTGLGKKWRELIKKGDIFANTDDPQISAAQALLKDGLGQLDNIGVKGKSDGGLGGYLATLQPSSSYTKDQMVFLLENKVIPEALDNPDHTYVGKKNLFQDFKDAAAYALNARQHQAFIYFTSTQYDASGQVYWNPVSDTQAISLVASLSAESNLDPGRVQFGGGPGRGLAQWEVGKNRYNTFEYRFGYSLSDTRIQTDFQFSKNSFYDQLGNVARELTFPYQDGKYLNSKYSNAGVALRATSTLEAASKIVTKTYEAPSSAGEFSRRVQQAQDIYDNFIKNGYISLKNPRRI